jgi:hypothetical protein
MAKRKSAKDKQRSTKHTYKTKDRVTRTPLKTEGELGCSGRVSKLNRIPSAFDVQYYITIILLSSRRRGKWRV